LVHSNRTDTSKRKNPAPEPTARRRSKIPTIEDISRAQQRDDGEKSSQLKPSPEPRNATTEKSPHNRSHHQRPAARRRKKGPHNQTRYGVYQLCLICFQKPKMPESEHQRVIDDLIKERHLIQSTASRFIKFLKKFNNKIYQKIDNIFRISNIDVNRNDNRLLFLISTCH
jgi:hypothetical protein